VKRSVKVQITKEREEEKNKRTREEEG